MKKSLAFLLSLALCCILTACGGQNAEVNVGRAPLPIS